MLVVLFLLIALHCCLTNSFGTVFLQKPAFPSRSEEHASGRPTINQSWSRLLSSSKSVELSSSDALENNNDLLTSSLVGHHVAVKTRKIEMAISFYSLLGFEVETKFRAGPARAAWLRNNDSRLELIEVPSYMLPEEGIPRAIDLTKHDALLGLNHIALNVTGCITDIKASKIQREEAIVNDDCGCPYGLNEYMNDLNKKSMEMFNKTLRVAVEPRQQIIGGNVYELSFIYDADGSLLELIYWTKDLENPNISSGWEPWDGKGFNGPKSQI